MVMGTAAEVRAIGLQPPMPGIEAAFAALGGVDRALASLPPEAGAAAEIPDELQAVRQRAREMAGAAGATDLDLRGLAEGHAVDLALGELRRAGARKGLVNLGGDRLAIFGEPLTVAVRDPESVDAPRWGSFTVSEAALGTTGSPRPGSAAAAGAGPGRPAGRVLAATVVARSALEAAALSASVHRLGAEEGLALLGRSGAAGFVLYREGGRKVLRATPRFAAAYALEAAPGVELRP
jgi:thiamine biosynthesis lipoprotein ApbE